MRKNILIVTPNLKVQGGVSSYWRSIIPELKKAKGIYLEYLEIGGRGRNVLGMFLDQNNLRKRIKKQWTKVVINPSLGFNSFFRDAAFAYQLKRKQIPFIVFFHGWDTDFEKQVDSFYRNLFMNTFGKAEKIIVLSETFKDKIETWGYYGKVVVETTAVEASLIANFSIKEKNNLLNINEAVIILCLARIIKEKGIFELIEAFKNVYKKNKNINLIIAGDGSDFDSVEERVKNCPNIKLYGYVEGDNKIGLFEKSHIYCLPSYSEGLPISVLEAMAFGLPILTTPVGGLKGFLQENKMGYFVKPKSVEGIESKLDILISDVMVRKQFSQFNFNYAKQKLLSDAVANRLLNLMLDT